MMCGQGFPVQSRYRQTWFASSSDDQRKRIENILGVKLFMGYTTRELGWLGFECENRRLHINEEWAYVEIINERGERVPDGMEGSVVVTTFDNRVMPFIRYRTGDIGTISRERCPCGRTLKTIRIIGRTAYRIELGNGTSASLLEVAGAFDRFFNAIRHFQIIQKGPSDFIVRVVAGPTFPVEKNDVHNALLRVLHQDVSITWDVVDVIPETIGGKAAYFVRDYR